MLSCVPLLSRHSTRILILAAMAMAVLPYVSPAVQAAPKAAQASCLLGVTAEGNLGIAGDTTPGTLILTLIDPADCSVCPPGAPLLLRSVQWRMSFDVSCQVNVRVAIFGSTTGPSCSAIPDTSVVLMPAFVTTLSSLPNPGGFNIGTYDVPFPTTLCLTGKAFVMVEFLDSSCDVNSYYLWTATNGLVPCVPCRQFSHEVGINAGIDDICSETPNMFTMAVPADCCAGVPTRPATWGRLKTLYR